MRTFIRIVTNRGYAQALAIPTSGVAFFIQCVRTAEHQKMQLRCDSYISCHKYVPIEGRGSRVWIFLCKMNLTASYRSLSA
ncbi:hypothetical protein D3OALGB2SA_4881 [Olavius algarvensis associated proteobacterium Delta 3]|nr:hypothetical protein D3OALGB2SA_4881 [Olavius algarvensis associated proteobacterium Delta 3]